MSYNFYDSEFQITPLVDSEFGLLDTAIGRSTVDCDPAHRSKWMARVVNNHPAPLTFTAIDKGVIQDTGDATPLHCDCMLASDKHLVFVELKIAKKGGWRARGKKQLASTIELYNASGAALNEKNLAYLCNKRQRSKTSTREEQRLFFDAYRFRFLISTEIMIGPEIMNSN